VTEEEADRLLRDLNQILDYVEQLQEVDVERVLEASHPIHHATPFRDDEVRSSLNQKEALMNAPDKKEGIFECRR